MIKYRLNCKKGHGFEAWFSDSKAYDKQVKRGLVSCPDCGSTKVEKALMAPSLATRGRKDLGPAPAEVDAKRRELVEMMRRVRRHVEANAEYVGPRFAEEARKIHHEEAAMRGIYGEASLEQAKELVDEGIDVMPLPRLPEDAT